MNILRQKYPSLPKEVYEIYEKNLDFLAGFRKMHARQYNAAEHKIKCYSFDLNTAYTQMHRQSKMIADLNVDISIMLGCQLID